MAQDDTPKARKEWLITDRPRYFAGQYLTKEDFDLQHRYLMSRVTYINKKLHIRGIIEGLEVQVNEEGTEFVITVGTAIDREGNVIVLRNDMSRVKRDKNVKPGQVFLMLLEYHSFPMRSRQDGIPNRYTRYEESPKITILPYAEYGPGIRGKWSRARGL